MIWSGNHLGHGTQIKDHVYIASHVCIAGHCVIGARSFLGVNATSADFTTIGADCFITLAASVTRNVPAVGFFLGAPSPVLHSSLRRPPPLQRPFFHLPSF